MKNVVASFIKIERQKPVFKNTYVLEEGDSIYYDSIVAHHVHAAADNTAKILGVVYTPY